jgi:hypothetical protein
MITDTPRTDAAQIADNIKSQSDPDKAWPWSAINRGYDKAREFERESARMREALIDMVSVAESQGWDNAEIHNARDILSNVRDHRCSPE